MKNKRDKKRSGPSVWVVLTIIAVIAMLAVIWVAEIRKINAITKERRARESAMEIAAVFAAADVAGYNFNTGIQAEGNIKKIVGFMMTHGISINGPGKYQGIQFRIGYVHEGASRYLYFDEGANSLIYIADPPLKDSDEE